MKVFKFGGASVKDASSIQNVGSILQNYDPSEPVVIVFSAMGKTTNALEALTQSYFYKEEALEQHFESIYNFHFEIIDELFSNGHPIFDTAAVIFQEMRELLGQEPTSPYNYIYDQLVPHGELLSTRIISAYLEELGIANKWLDARGLIRTDNNHRTAHVDWSLTVQRVSEQIPAILEKQPIVTQGFIGGTDNGTTTLGREGSDYTAAIFGSILNASEVIVWKDVPGVLSADPKQFSFAQKIDQLSYYEAIEMTYYGAKVLHPKTIKPLENKEIPLQVRSFIEPQTVGTVIQKQERDSPYPPIVIRKSDQTLFSILTKDFSFISEKVLSEIYGLFDQYNVTINMLQIAAVSVSICVENRPSQLAPLQESLQEHFKLLTNEHLELYTIRHYDDAILEKLLADKKTYLEQRTRHTLQVVVK